MRCPAFPHIDIIVLICLIWVSTTTAIQGAVDIGDSCFSMSSTSSVLWVRLDTGDEDDANATVITADGHSCVLPNQRIIKGSWKAELVFDVSPTWQCRLPGDDIELKAKKGGGFISCHEEIEEAEKEVEVMVSYYNHVVATHAALFTTAMSTSTTSTTTTTSLPLTTAISTSTTSTTTTNVPLTTQSTSIHTTSSSVVSPTNFSVQNNKSDHSKVNKKSSGKRKRIKNDQGEIENKKKKINKHVRQKTKSNKRNKNVQKDIGKEQGESASNMPQQDKTSHFLPPDYSQVTPDASWFTKIKRKNNHTHTTEKANDWEFDSSNPYQDDHSYTDSSSTVSWDTKPHENTNTHNRESSDTEKFHNINKETPQDLSLFQFHDGISLSTKEYIIIGTGSVIGIALLISATILIIVLRRKKREEAVDYWV